MWITHATVIFRWSSLRVPSAIVVPHVSVLGMSVVSVSLIIQRVMCDPTVVCVDGFNVECHEAHMFQGTGKNRRSVQATDVTAVIS